MFRVALCTLLAGARRNVVGRMQAFARRKPRCNLGVAIQTLQRRLAAELVTTGAVRGSV